MVKSPSAPSTLDVDSFLQEMNKDENPLTWETHKDVHFWTRKDYDDWMDSPEAQHSNHGLYAYLEKEDGKVPEADKLMNIWKALRAGWMELAQHKMAPDTWGKASTSAWQFIHLTMEKKYPIFKLAEDGWKLENLCTYSYPSWRLHHLDVDGNLKKNVRNTVKEETSDEDKDLKDHKPIVKKRKGHADTSRLSSKKHKGESYHAILSTDRSSRHSGEHARCSREHRSRLWTVIQPIQSFRHCRSYHARFECALSYSLAYSPIEAPVHNFLPSEEAAATEQSRDSEHSSECWTIILTLLTIA